MATMQKITSNLWFNNQAEEAAKFYTSVFKNSRIGRIARYGKEGQEVHRMPEGTVLTVEFWLEEQGFVALNGGPHSNSMKPFHSLLIAIRRKKLIIIGTSFPKAVMRKRRCAAG